MYAIFYGEKMRALIVERGRVKVLVITEVWKVIFFESLTAVINKCYWIVHSIVICRLTQTLS